MAIPSLLKTKLFIPRSRKELVRRTRLVEALNALPQHRLVLVSAPAGFGKTTAVASWSAAHSFPTAWVSLDGRDNDENRFLAYLVEAVAMVRPGFGEGIRQALAAVPAPPATVLTDMLINDLAGIDEDILLVLDDYHLIEESAVHDLLLFLIEYAPPSFHILISTRSDPPFPLARFRAQGELLELRAADLRFDLDETRAFLNELMGLSLTDTQTAALLNRTEGWAAGLQMAALSMRDRHNVQEFLNAFTGADRFILDYLLEEVLAVLPEDLLKPMLELSILDRFDAPLCRAVTGREDSEAILVELEGRNLFLIPLDNHRGWYRYHHLFADLLRHRLGQRSPDSLPELHRRAALRLEEEGLTMEAADHARRSGDSEFLAGFLERNWRSLLRDCHDIEMEALFAGLPKERVKQSTTLSLLSGWLAVVFRRNEEGGERLRWVVAHIGENPTGENREILGHCRLLQAVTARDAGRAEEGIRYAEEALELLPDYPPDSPLYLWNSSRGIVLSVLGGGYSMTGEYRKAERIHREALQYGRARSDFYCMVTALANLGRDQLVLGALKEAEQTAAELHYLLEEKQVLLATIRPVPHQLVARAAAERFECDAAEQAARHALTLCDERRKDQQLELRRTLFLIEDARGNRAGAEAILQEMEALHMEPGDRRLLAIPMMLRALLAIRNGDRVAAAEWEGRTFGDDEAFAEHRRLRRIHHTGIQEAIVRTRFLLLCDRRKEAAESLQNLAEDLERREMTGNLLEVLILHALLAARESSEQEAFALLTRALRLAAPERFVRPFVCEGPELAGLLTRLRGRRLPEGVGTFLTELLEACEGTVSSSKRIDDLTMLTPRELEILRLMEQGYPNRVIAEKLYVSVNTVKTHIAHLFDKLGARRRTEALQHARRAGILDG